MILGVTEFLGIAPKIASTSLGVSQAQWAINAKLWSGALRPLNGQLFNAVLVKSTGEIKTIWRYNNDTDWLCWTQDVDIVRSPVAGDTIEKIYYTGTDKPRATTKDLYSLSGPGTNVPPASFVLGIPVPQGAPVATTAGAGNITASCAWVYTYVRRWTDGTADEGPPSLPSNVITLNAQQANVTMPATGITFSDYGITAKRLYRTNGTLYFYVTEVAVGTASALDNVATANLGSELTTEGYLPPPDGMIGITELSTGVVAGFMGNTVYLSEPYRPWAYPVRNRYSVGWPIVSIAGFGASVIVGTQGYPYIGRGTDPAAYNFRPAQGARYPCMSKRSMAVGQVGVFWATNDGIVLATENSVNLVTREFLTQEEFQRDFYPKTMHAMVYEDRYYAWYSNGVNDKGHKVGFGLTLDRSERAFLTTRNQYVDAVGVSPDDGFMFIVRRGTDGTNQVFKFDVDPATPIAYDWKSKVYVTGSPENLGFCQIIADYSRGLTVKQIEALMKEIEAIREYNRGLESNGMLNMPLLNDGLLNGSEIFMEVPNLDFVDAQVLFRYWGDGILRLTRMVKSKEPFPMPSGFEAEKHEFALGGEIEVSSVQIASSMEELGQRG